MPAPDFTFAAYGFGLLAGVLSILSPCVLPLLPIALGSALTTHRFGAVALSLGLALSFVIVGLFVATIGFSIGLDGDLFRRIGAVFLLLFGCLMLFPRLQARATSLLAHLPGTGLGARLQAGAQAYRPSGIGGQLLLGLLLGVVWSPCVGPTMGAAATLAAQRQDLGGVAVMMLVFGIGASLPLLAIGLGLGYWRDRAAAGNGETSGSWRRAGLVAGRFGRILLGGLLVLLGLLILSGHDREIEAQLVDWSPAWLTALTTRF